MLRGGTSRGLVLRGAGPPADPAARDDLLLRLMGTPDPRQIDGLGGATTLTSKVAVVSPSDDPDVDVDYLFLQLGVDQADGQRPAELRQHPRRRRAVRGRARPRARRRTARPACASAWSTPTASPSPPSRRRGAASSTAGDVAIAGVPGHGRAGRPRVHRHRGVGDRRAAADRARPGHRRGHRGHLRRQRHAGRPRPRRVVRAHRVRAARGAGRRRGAARADRRLPPQGRRS